MKTSATPTLKELPMQREPEPSGLYVPYLFHDEKVYDLKSIQRQQTQARAFPETPSSYSTPPEKELFVIGLLVDRDEPTSLEDEFERLRNRWHESTHFLSSPSVMHADESYRTIVALGRDVVPLIIEELRRSPDHWFHALEELTGQDPVPQEHWGNMPQMARDWVEWFDGRDFG